MTPDMLINNIAVQQGGIVLAEQAIECGLTGGMIRYRVRSKRWHPIAPNIYRLLDMNGVFDPLRAAVIALPGAVVSHHSAALLHSLPSVPRRRPSVAVHTRTTHTFPGVTVHRNHDLKSGHVTELDGLPVTTLPRTVIDLAACLSAKRLTYIVDDLIAAGRLAVDDLQNLFGDVARRGKPGSTVLRAILEERAEGASYPGSRLESLGLALLIDSGLPRPEAEYPMPWQPGRRFDLAYPQHRLSIEWDSRRWHSQVDAFERDRKRDRLAILNGWRVLRFTWVDVDERPDEVVRTVREALGH